MHGNPGEGDLVRMALHGQARPAGRKAGFTRECRWDARSRDRLPGRSSVPGRDDQEPAGHRIAERDAAVHVPEAERIEE